MAVRVGFIGTGGIARPHLENLVRLDGVEVVALCDVRPEAVDVARQHVNERLEKAGVTRKLEGETYTDHNVMIKEANLDAVYLCLPPFVHGEPEMAAIEANLPILVEKPVALTLETALKLEAEIKKRGLIAASGYQLRYANHLQAAKEALEGKRIAQAFVARWTNTPGTPWYHIQEKSGGMLVEMATHQVDMLRFLIGEIETVYAEADLLLEHADRPGFSIHDVNSMTLRFKNRAVGSFINNLISGSIPPPGIGGTHVMAEGMTVSITGGTTITTVEGKEEIKSEVNAMYEEDKAFVEAVRTKDASGILSDYSSGVMSLAVTIAALESARTGQPINVDALIEDVRAGKVSA